MKLILQHAGQTVEREFVTQAGQPLTNAQATQAINLLYALYAGETPGSPTTTEKAQRLVDITVAQMIARAKEQRRKELSASNESQITTELG